MSSGVPPSKPTKSTSQVPATRVRPPGLQPLAVLPQPKGSREPTSRGDDELNGWSPPVRAARNEGVGGAEEMASAVGFSPSGSGDEASAVREREGRCDGNGGSAYSPSNPLRHHDQPPPSSEDGHGEKDAIVNARGPPAAPPAVGASVPVHRPVACARGADDAVEIGNGGSHFAQCRCCGVARSKSRNAWNEDELDRYPHKHQDGDGESAAAAATPLFTSGCCSGEESALDTDSWQRQPRRRHGFHRPLHPQQVAAWGAITLFTTLYACGVGPGYAAALQQHEERWVRGRWPAEAAPQFAALVLLFLVVFTSMIVTTLVDVTDWGREGGSLCEFCNFVTGASAKHCKACNRCVEGFDHHCKWLNCCIGRDNYRPFIVFVASTFATVVFLFVSTIHIVTLHFNARGFNSWHQASCIITIVLAGACIPPLAHLLLFHAYINWRGISTFDYILEQRAKIAAAAAATTTTTTTLGMPS